MTAAAYLDVSACMYSKTERGHGFVVHVVREAEMKSLASRLRSRRKSKQQSLKREIRWRLANLDWTPMHIRNEKPRVRYKIRFRLHGHYISGHLAWVGWVYK